MSKKEYNSHIDKPVVHTTSKGGSYVTPFDVVRSKVGREVINDHASKAKSALSDSASPQRGAYDLQDYKKAANNR